MRERKPSFLERLTGTQIVGDAKEAPRGDDNVLSEKPWSPSIDAPTGRVPEVPESEPTAGEMHATEAEAKEEVAPEHVDASNETPETDPAEDAPEEDEDASLAVDMYESDNEVIIQSMIAGVTPENLHITITKEAVTIRGARIAPEGIPEEQRLLRELYWGSFSREIALPCAVDTENAEAVEKYGLLVIRLPKINPARTQEIKVKSVE